jgi:hypothetical protein
MRPTRHSRSAFAVLTVSGTSGIVKTVVLTDFAIAKSTAIRCGPKSVKVTAGGTHVIRAHNSTTTSSGVYAIWSGLGRMFALPASNEELRRPEHILPSRNGNHFSWITQDSAHIAGPQSVLRRITARPCVAGGPI